MSYEPNIYGLETMPLPEGWMAIECVSVIKCLDEDGDVVWCSRVTEKLSTIEALGMLDAAREVLNRAAGDMFRPEADDEDDD